MYEVSPFSTNVGEMAPSKLKIPFFFIVQPIALEDSKEYIKVERINSCVQHTVLWSLGCWRGRWQNLRVRQRQFRGMVNAQCTRVMRLQQRTDSKVDTRDRCLAWIYMSLIPRTQPSAKSVSPALISRPCRRTRQDDRPQATRIIWGN